MKRDLIIFTAFVVFGLSVLLILHLTEAIDDNSLISYRTAFILNALNTGLALAAFAYSKKPSHLGWACSKQNPALCKALDKFMSTISKKKFFGKLFNKYFGIEYPGYRAVLKKLPAVQ